MPEQKPSRWLLLRGLGREAGHWFGFAERLAQRVGQPTLALDLPGVGQRAGEPGRRSIGALAAAIAERVDRDPGAGCWGVVGLSLGGMVALALARQLPMSVARVVLINSSSRLSPQAERLQPAGRRALVAAVAQRDALERERRLYALTTNDETKLLSYARAAVELHRAHPVSPSTVLWQLLAAAMFLPPVIEQPTLVLAGRCDRLVSWRCSDALARHLRAPLVIHPTGGHDLVLDEPEWVLNEFEAWLAR